MKKRIVIQFCVTAKEKRAIQRAAKAEATSVSRWLVANAAERIRNAHGDDIAKLMGVSR